MIHIITNLYKINSWQKIQEAYLKKYTSQIENVNIICGFVDTEIPNDSKYIYLDLNNFHKKISSEHYQQMNFIADSINKIYEFKNINNECKDEDIIIFMDIDAFPCEYNWDVKIINYLNEFDIACVVMKENKGLDDNYDDLPHLCFFATKYKTWKKEKLKWSLEGYENPQMGMKLLIKKNQLKVKELLRTNKFNVSRVCCGVYDDLVYHQACGIRGFQNSVCEGADIYCREKNMNLIDIQSLDAKIWKMVYENISNDHEKGNNNFVRRYFMGKN